MRRLAVGAIRLYQICISRFLPRVCRFQPTCSEYAAQAILAHGLLRGGWMSLRRISRCHPLSPGGLDPVPAAHSQRPSQSSDSVRTHDSVNG